MIQEEKFFFSNSQARLMRMFREKLRSHVLVPLPSCELIS
jgi:hypothetical protein